jgi:hypothetical protein
MAVSPVVAQAIVRVERTGSYMPLLQLILEDALPKVLIEMIAQQLGPAEPQQGTFMFRSAERRNWHGFLPSEDCEWFVHSNASVRECIMERLTALFRDAKVARLPLHLQSRDAQQLLCAQIHDHTLSVEDAMHVFWNVQRQVGLSDHTYSITALVHVATKQRTKSRVPVFALYRRDFPQYRWS